MPSRSSPRTLEKIEVELWQVYDQRSCMQYEMREVMMKSNTEAFVPTFELPGEDALVKGPELMEYLTIVRYECLDARCRGHQGGFVADGGCVDVT